MDIWWSAIDGKSSSSWITGPPLIFRHPWFQSLSGIIYPFCRANRGHGLRKGPPRGRDTGPQSRLWGRICRLQPGRSSRGPAAGGKFDPPISRGSTDKVEIRRLTRPRAPHLRGDFQRDFKCTLVIFSGSKEALDHLLPGDQWWTCIMLLFLF